MNEARARIRKAKPIPTYPGPSVNEVNALSDAKVSKELSRLNVEPRPRPMTFFDDPAWMDDSKPPKVWTKDEIKAEEKKTDDLHQRCLRAQLLSAYIAEWLRSLKDAPCWLLVEAHEGQKIAISERRYTAPDKLRERARWRVYASEVNKQTQLTTNRREIP